MGTAAPPAGDVATFRFSTNDYSERERLTAWREIFGRTVCNLDIEPLAADRFRSDSTIYARPGLGVLAGSCSAVHLSHSKDLIVDDDLSFMTGSMPNWTVALGATREAAEIANGRGVHAARLRAIKMDLAANLGRAELSINAVAARHGVTPRYVQMLFEIDGTTFSQQPDRQTRTDASG